MVREIIWLAAILSLFTACKKQEKTAENSDVQHISVYHEAGKFAAWPANGGMWAWGDELLVCYSVADHEVKQGHTYDIKTARNQFSRSRDGGLSWQVENAWDGGIKGLAMDHQVGDSAVVPVPLTEAIDFQHPDFAFLFQRESNNRGPCHFYYTYDRGHSWKGPYAFPELDSMGITNRTDYIIDGPREMRVFMSIGHGRTAMASTSNGGLSWELVSYIGPDFTLSEITHQRNDYSLMPSSVRLSDTELYTTVRHREGPEGHVWITAYRSMDNGLSWQPEVEPVTDHVNSPPALLTLPDGRLALAYIHRRGGWGLESDGSGQSSLCIKISDDNGKSWSEPYILRSEDGANVDCGYPRAVLNASGQMVLVYYWNHSLGEQKEPYRYIAATICDPALFDGSQSFFGFAE
ncbi:MAG: exo-alpha-sialidase [Cyclobacteriaceae bacterium]|nr:exo-alpha-sialidase [Cyclobacteriaceae bacterium]